MLSSCDELARRATVRHQAGDLDEARKLYLQALAENPRHGPGLYGLGVLAYQLGGYEAAAKLLQRAAEADPASSTYRIGLGAALEAQGRRSEALAHYQTALTLNPADATTHFRIGTVQAAEGRLKDAQQSFEQALTLAPNYPEAHNNLAVVLRDQGCLKEAAEHCRTALLLKPDYAAPHTNLGNIAADLGNLDEARIHLEQAIALNPEADDAHNNLGNLFRKMGRLDDAIASLQRALALNPSSAEMHNNIGSVLEDAGKLNEAKLHFERAIALKPGYVTPHNNLGNVLRRLAQYADARQSYDRALAMCPDDVEALWNRSLLDLHLGNYQDGWRGYEARHQRAVNRPRQFEQPIWRGESLAAKRILLHSEQGLGDSLQFLRYVPMVRAAGATVLLVVPRALHRLCAQMEGVDSLHINGEPLPPFDVHCPLMSLPLAFQTAVDTIPREIPYLKIPEAARAKANTIPWPQDKFRVGLAWCGNPDHIEDRRRSLPLQALQPILDIERVQFYSLQIGAGAEELKQMNRNIVDLQPQIADMADTAALLEHLDLIITVDTAVAHLAGALGRPAWVLLAYASDWRWLTERHDSPWYPSLRLFRQSSHEDWSSVIEQIHASLLAEIASTTTAIG